jgi:TolB-like protein
MRTLRRPSINDRAMPFLQAARLPFDSIAVLARPSGGGVHAAVLADVLGEDLAFALGRSRRLRVPCAEFVRPYAQSDLSPEEIGRALNVRGVALCTVASAAASVDVTVDVIDVVREAVVVHDAFLVSAREVPALARAIARVIPGHGRAAAKCGPAAEIVEARVALANGDAEGALEILGASFPLERAATIIEGRLCARIGEARSILTAAAWPPHSRVRALQLRAKLASRFDADWLAAERALREALEIDAASPSTHAMLGDVLLATRRLDDAAPHHRLYAELMPADPRAQLAGAFGAYFGPIPLDAAAPLAMLPDANAWLVRALIAGGDVLRAQQAAATPFGRALVAAFTRDEIPPASFSAGERALLFSAAGAVDEAVDCLDSAAAQQADEALFAAVEPLFFPLHGSARFTALLARLGLPA